MVLREGCGGCRARPWAPRWTGPPTGTLLAQVLRHLEGVADGSPHDLGVHAVRQGALDRAPAELIEHEVLGHALRVGITELRVHPVPEFRQPHAPRLLPLPGRERRGGGSTWMLPSRHPGRLFARCVVIKYMGSRRARRTS